MDHFYISFLNATDPQGRWSGNNEIKASTKIQAQ